MKLNEYMKQNKLTNKDVYEQLGISRPTLWRWIAGKSLPHRSQLEAIIAWSGGQVTPNDFL